MGDIFYKIRKYKFNDVYHIKLLILTDSDGVFKYKCHLTFVNKITGLIDYVLGESSKSSLDSFRKARIYKSYKENPNIEDILGKLLPCAEGQSFLRELTTDNRYKINIKK